MDVLKKLIAKSRLLEILYDNCAPQMKKSALYTEVLQFFQAYLDHHQIGVDDAISSYEEFIIYFNKHIRGFAKTGRYPAEIGVKDYHPNRNEYDLVLMLSVLFSAHRFEIMRLVQNYNCTGNTLYIGIGPGLELAINNNKKDEIHVYDLEISSFIQEKYPQIYFFEELYTGQQKDYFNNIFLIELLEHLENPYELIKICHSSLKKGGNLLLTTASDLPQFDHLYNFSKDHSIFEKKIIEVGFKILQKNVIPHQYLLMQIEPINTFYILQKI